MPSYTTTVTLSAFSGTNTNTWSNVNTQTRTGYTTPNPTSNTYSDTSTFTRTSVTLPSGLRRMPYLAQRCILWSYTVSFFSLHKIQNLTYFYSIASSFSLCHSLPSRSRTVYQRTICEPLLYLKSS